MTSDNLPLKKTPLYSLHLEWNARMVGFAGYEMPVQYQSGIIKEHRHTRIHAGLFDISHMGQIRISGDNVSESLERLTPGDFTNLPLNRQRYTWFTNNQGGVIDDCMVTHRGDHLLIVANASRKEQVFDHLKSNLAECDVTEVKDRALFALQGPEASKVMERFVPDACQLPFMSSASWSIRGAECIVNRCGYTGEDGYELMVPMDQAEKLARLFMAQDKVEVIGLGARDSLRLEAGLCLYGHDIDENTSPIEAGLNWIIAKKYLGDNARSAIFPGAEKIMRDLRDEPVCKRVGLKPDGRVPVREGARLFNKAGDIVGRVTSGGFGPTVESPVAMGYLNTDYAQVGTWLDAMVRDRLYPVAVVNLPFVPHCYHK